MKSLLVSTLILIAVPSSGDDAAPLVVHEWGTFTSLQDEQGRAIGGINVEDEAVPGFVHELKAHLLVPPDRLAPVFYKGTPRVHPHVTLRLETPVVYFHPPPGAEPVELDVEVVFRGGWLTQYYPIATPHAPGLDGGQFRFGSLSAETRGSLTWKGLVVGSREGVAGDPGPPTDAPVWLAPRQVDAAPVSTPEGESERFLFYRGVAHADAPLQVARDTSGARIEIRARTGDWTRSPRLLIERAWLVDVAERDAGTAFRELGPFELGNEETYATTLDFKTWDYSRSNLELLRESMQADLVRAGLNDDEARALLDTWQHSYFASPGRRLFFLVPREWTDFYLPLSLSTPAELVRVMVGRIELVTPAQRERLREIGNDPGSYALYRSLGRFANALVLDELARRPTPGLRAFVETYRLQGHATDR